MTEDAPPKRNASITRAQQCVDTIWRIHLELAGILRDMEGDPLAIQVVIGYREQVETMLDSVPEPVTRGTPEAPR